LALGLVAFRGHEWVAGVPEGLAPVRVSVTRIPVEHAVKIWSTWRVARPIYTWQETCR
jgi:hypothetical protein